MTEPYKPTHRADTPRIPAPAAADPASPGTPLGSEPAITIGTISAVIAAAIALLVAFGVPITEGQQATILGVVAAVGPIITGIITRHYVTPAR